MDKIDDALLQGLKAALARAGEQRLYRSGKLDGLFPGRTGVSAEAAARALREGLLEIVRTETRGKTVFEWARLTPAGARHIHDHESPIQLLRELRSVLAASRDGVPTWLEAMRRDLAGLGDRLAEEVRGYVERLRSLEVRVEETLRRADALAPHKAEGLAATVPWAQAALDYLDQRAVAGGQGCPLPELFAALRGHQADLSVTAFHDGLRRLSDLRALRLLAALDPAAPLPEPEHALLDGATVLYYAAR